MPNAALRLVETEGTVQVYAEPAIFLEALPIACVMKLTLVLPILCDQRYRAVIDSF
jgi:hypothetical protein